MEFSDRLLSVAQILIEESNRLKASGDITKKETPYVKFKVDFEFEGGRITSLSIDTEETLKSEFGAFNRNISELSRSVIKLLTKDDFSECITNISKIGNVPLPDAAGIFRQFINKLAYEVIKSDGLSDINLSTLITNFIDELNKEPDWQIVIWLSGIWVDQGQLEIREGAILRQPRASDFESEIPLSFLPFYHEEVDHMSVMSVLEITVYQASQRQATSEIKYYTNLLRLFRLGQITSLKHVLSPSRLTGTTFGTNVPDNTNLSARYTYQFKPDDVNDFVQYYKQVRPHLDDLEKQDNFISIAYSRYHDALSSVLVEGRIAFAINCLEALYLTESVELSHRLSQRTAALIRLKAGETGPIIYKMIKEAYGIRSAFVHGESGKTQKRRKAANELSEPILNYARMSLLIFLQLSKVIHKNDFLELIDRSFLDETSHKELIDLMESIVVT